MDTLFLIFQIVIGLLLLTFLVVIHELGHAIVARRNKVEVEEFGIGFPPRAWGRVWATKLVGKKTLWSVNWLPLGGFVKLKGESDDARGKGAYGAASLWAKTKILMAGVAMNWLFAIVAFTILALVGMPKLIDNQFRVPSDTVEKRQPLKVDFVEKNSPAEKAGLELNNQIISINGQEIKSPESLATFTKAHKGQTVEIVFKKGLSTESEKVTLRKNPGQKQGILGVSTASQTTLQSTWSAPIVGVGTTVQLSALTLTELGKMVGKLASGVTLQVTGDDTAKKKGSEQVGEAGANVAGPIGILGVIFPAAQKAGPVVLLLLMGIISLTLAVINVLPIPALDGGRLFVTLLYRGLGKKLTKDVEEKIHGTGFAFLMLLVVLVTVADVFKFI